MNENLTPAQPMAVEDAARALAEIDAVTARVRQSRIYLLASATLILWGPLVALGYALTQFMPRYAMYTWPLCHLVGIGVTAMLVIRERRAASRRGSLLVLTGLVITIGFGLVWSVVLGRFGPREMSAFWPTLFMFGYVIAGLWFGRAFMALGIAVTALTLAGYFWVDRWFDLYMAAVNGGGLLLCGLWMRRA